MIEPQTPIVKIGTVIPKLGTVLSIGKNQVMIQVNDSKQINCSFGEIERFIGV
jgi:sRNA-binding carbon storage regulator CsrA